MTENAEHSRLVARANKEAPDCDEEAQRSLSYAWLIIKERMFGKMQTSIENIFQRFSVMSIIIQRKRR